MNWLQLFLIRIIGRAAIERAHRGDTGVQPFGYIGCRRDCIDVTNAASAHLVAFSNASWRP